MNRLRYIAVHEAAHVVAYCHLGEGIVDAWLKPGREGGLVTHPPVVNTAEAMMCILAGTYAEARYRRKSVVECTLYGGRGDYEAALDIATAMGFDDGAKRHALMRQVERDIKAFIGMPEIRRQIEIVADVLMRDGYIDGALAADIAKIGVLD